MAGLRIIAGKAKGRRIKSVPGDTTRPITDRIKEALFNIIGPDIEDSRFLDLFAGSGSVGIEALSRGANFVLFIDINRLPVETIRSNLLSTKLGENSNILRQDAFSFLSQKNTSNYHYIYIAPPQYLGLWKKAVLDIDESPEILSEDGWVIVQIHPVEEDILDNSDLKNLELFDRRDYGSTLLLFYNQRDVDPGMEN